MSAIINYFRPFDYSNYYFQESKIVKPYHTYIYDAVTYIPSAAWEKVKSKFSNSNAFIQSEMQKITSEVDDAKKQDLFVKALTSTEFHILRPSLKVFFSGLSDDSKDEYLKACVLEGVKQRKNDLVTRCLHLLSETELLDLIKAKKNLPANYNFVNLVNRHIKRVDINAKYQPYDPAMTFIKSEIKTLIPQAFNFLMSIFDTLMMSTELFEVGQAPKSAWDAAYQLDVYYRIISIPTTILWAINAYLPNPIVTGAAFTLTMITLVGFIYSYVKWLKPTTNHAPKTVNLTEKAEQGHIAPVIARGLEIAMIIYRLVQNLVSGNTEHMLLIGDSGVGKTTIIEGLALKIASGNVPPELKGAKVFITNAAKLSIKDQLSGKSPLDQIRKAIGKDKHKIILVVDEIHSLIKDPTLRTELLSLLDQSTESIPMFIGITSTDQYQNAIDCFKEPATERRLNGVIEIKETDEDQTLTILKSMLQLYYPEVSEMSHELLKKLYNLNKLNKKSLEPLNSKNSLSVLAEKIRSGLQGNHLRDELDRLKALLEKEESSESGRINGDKLLEDDLDNIEDLENQIQNKEDEIAKFNKTVKSYKSLKNDRRDREVFLKNIANKINKADIHAPATKTLLHQFLFEQFYLLPSMDEGLKVFTEEHHLEVSITDQMIKDKFFPGYKQMSDVKDEKYIGNVISLRKSKNKEVREDDDHEVEKQRKQQANNDYKIYIESLELERKVKTA